MRTKLFISYSHDDERWLERVRTQLTVLERTGLLEVFADTDISAGEAWFSRLEAEITQARVALLLISASFLGSAFILEEEIPRLLDRHEADGMVLYPLLLSDCPWQFVPWLAAKQMRPAGVRPVAERRGGSVDKCLADVAREIASLLNDGQKSYSQHS
jgi:TIR domain